MFLYLYNTPVKYTDPSGNLLITFAATIGLAIIGTIIVMAIEYAKKESLTAVIDISLVIPSSMPVSPYRDLKFPSPANPKVGLSTIFDFSSDENRIEFYLHGGVTYGMSSGFSASVGYVDNYTKEGDFKGLFANFGGGYFIGVDHSYDPRYDYRNTVKATSLTFSTGPYMYGGVDYYIYLKCLNIRLE